MNFNLKNLKDPNSWLFISFQSILDDSVVIFSVFFNFFKIKVGDLISWGETIMQNDWIIWSQFLYFKL